jgi:hypothetical protein
MERSKNWTPTAACLCIQMQQPEDLHQIVIMRSFASICAHIPILVRIGQEESGFRILHGNERLFLGPSPPLKHLSEGKSLSKPSWKVHRRHVLRQERFSR